MALPGTGLIGAPGGSMALPGTGLIGAPPGVLGQPIGPPMNGAMGQAPPGLAATGRPARADVAYGADARHRLDVYSPVGSVGPAPLVLFVHGGGWAIGDKNQFGWVGEQLAQQGVVAAVMNYRLSPTVQHPEHTKDVARALAWLHRNGAQLGGDPHRLYVAGHSAGAHMAALVALDRSYLLAEGLNSAILKGVIGIAGPSYDLDARYAQSPIAPILQSAFGADVGKWGQAAPVRYVQPYAPNFLLIYGTADNQALPLSTQSLATALQQGGVPTQLETLQGQDHFSVLGAALPIMRRFMQ